MSVVRNELSALHESVRGTSISAPIQALNEMWWV